jgi:trehalose synthase-fused probable maltokinase
MSRDIEGLRQVVAEGLAAWLPRQRWYGGGKSITEVHMGELTALEGADPVVAVCIAGIHDDEGGEAHYNVPLGISGRGGVRPSDPGAILHEDDDTLIFDALADARTTAPLWRILARGEPVMLQGGALVPGGGGLDPEITDIGPLNREQSNTSLVVGNEHLLKVMRRIVFEPSVELEMTQALVRAGFDHVAAPEAWIHYERDGSPHPALLALTQRYLHNGTEGWTLALTSLRDLYADAEEHLGGDAAQRIQAVEEAGGSFTPDAARLGEITAQMHLALAQATGDQVTPQPITKAMLGGWADEMLAELDGLARSGDPAIAALREHVEPLRARIEAIRTLTTPGLAIRIHGDFHLGQVLRTDAGWIVLDFEGEPRRSVEHRRRLHSPLRDVAGMLRSFDYAAAVALLERCTPDDPGYEDLAAHGRSWAAANRDAFWSAYVERTAGTELLPDAGAALTLRRAFEIQKAVYEVDYERAHRPQWVTVPLRFLLEATA